VTAVTNGLTVCRAGIAAPGLAGAVGRNRVRRRVRAAIGPVIGAHAGFDLVISVGSGSLDLTFAELSSALVTAAGRAVSRARPRTPAPAAHNEPTHTAASAINGREPIP